eukprot:2609991-Karenia_brevis.AAC.1
MHTASISLQPLRRAEEGTSPTNLDDLAKFGSVVRSGLPRVFGHSSGKRSPPGTGRAYGGARQTRGRSRL